MTKYRVRYSWHAVDDLDSIFDYISDENRAAAVRLLERIEDVMHSRQNWLHLIFNQDFET